MLVHRGPGNGEPQPAPPSWTLLAWFPENGSVTRELLRGDADAGAATSQRT